MKTKQDSRPHLAAFLFCAALAILPGGLAAQLEMAKPGPVPEATILERGPHSRVWQNVRCETNGDGSVLVTTNVYTELATGICFQDPNDPTKWIDSEELIELAPGGAVATRGQHKVSFAANLNTAGAIHLIMPDGKELNTHLIGVAYTDAASGKSELIGQLKDSIGQLISRNQVLYKDAFTDINADVRYTYTLAGLEQDIIIRSQLPDPSAWGLSPATVRLETYTEMLQPPAGSIQANTLKRQDNPFIRQRMAEPDLIDQTVDFGGMWIGPGSAFMLDNRESELGTVPVAKTFERRENRDLLIEKVV